MSLSKPLVDFELFCSKHTDCEAPIAVISEILAENDLEKFKFISEKFDELNFTIVKDLAGSIIRKADRDTVAPLYRAIEIYNKHDAEGKDNILKSAKSKFQNENFINKQNLCKESFKQNPKELNIILRIAESHFNQKNYEKCIEWLKRAEINNPNCREILINLALVHIKQSNNNSAKLCLFKVCAMEPYDVEAWTDYANFLSDTNELVDADACYVRALALNPTLDKVRNDHGKLLLKLNKIKEAKKEFKIAHNNAKKCPITLNYLAYAYYQCGKFRKSILRYEQILDIDPDMSNVYFYLGMSYFKIKEYQNALNAFIQAMAQEPKNVRLLKNIAVTYCYLEEMELCTVMYKKCLTLIPEDYKLNLDLALIYLLNIKDYQEAVKYLKICIQLHPGGTDLLDLYTKLFQAYRKSNNRLNASDVCMKMGDLYLEKDDQENAKNSFCCAALMNQENAFAHWKIGLTTIHDLDLALPRFKCAVILKPNLINVMMSLSSGIEGIKHKMQWCSSWWCPKHGPLIADMPWLNAVETPKEEKKALSLAIKRQKHWITKTKVKCCVFDRKAGKNNHSVPPDIYSKYLRNLVNIGDGSIQSPRHSEADVDAAIIFFKDFVEQLKLSIRSQ
ncbi:probable UDP-N-acetylglucosamine--peptide N-acetylglucosaminyltransferase SEC [Acyrthosiphon pisum]|uniref:Uncharacterized protein n=1 Tax=Acyrthosiphon pisum TaxID=7029 RepID=A0A8R1WAI4_ACYPI|nr:probable UDP-N-acetylglucosamine--peptide N-acetylglucosaminyltransferase SEC [Acyrthosiphon pisum]|eukprot:XP_003243575.1 PREDICTED: probable UDP-N-acetylglucosamine--peptide N-acetylglucosaminyltransferase SEC [Acyrthosiphon pisum]